MDYDGDGEVDADPYADQRDPDNYYLISGYEYYYYNVKRYEVSNTLPSLPFPTHGTELLESFYDNEKNNWGTIQFHVWLGNTMYYGEIDNAYLNNAKLDDNFIDYRNSQAAKIIETFRENPNAERIPVYKLNANDNNGWYEIALKENGEPKNECIGELVCYVTGIHERMYYFLDDELTPNAYNGFLYILIVDVEDTDGNKYYVRSDSAYRRDDY